MKKRVSLFAGYDPNGIIHDYVLYFIKSLAHISDVYFYCDNPLAANEAQKLEGLATLCGAERHGKYDFGSWAAMIDRIGWNRLSQYDELILANDSCYGPFHDLSVIFDHMAEKKCDFWGMTSNQEIALHVQSYFMVFHKNVMADPCFRAFWKTIEVEDSYDNIVKKYEIGLSQILISQHFTHDTYIKSKLIENLTIFPLTMLKYKNFPFIKVKCFKDPYISSRERVSLLFKHIKKENFEFSRMIYKHQESKFLSRAIFIQKNDPPFYWKIGFFRIRNIRGNKLKIIILNRFNIKIYVGNKIMNIISRCPYIRANI